MRTVLILSLLAIPLLGQPGTCYTGGTTAGCPCVAGQDPCVQTFVQEWTTSYNALVAATGVSKPIVVSSNISVASTTYRGSDGANCNNGSSVFSTATGNSISVGLNKYMDNIIGPASAIGQGVSAIVYNYDPTYYMEAPQYSTYCSAGGNICGTPASPSNAACQLGVDLAFLTHAASLGLKIYLSSAPEANTFTACGLTPGSLTSMTLANIEKCLNPTEQAAIAYYQAQGITISLFNADTPGGFEYDKAVAVAFPPPVGKSLLNGDSHGVQ